jgi:hypothetical protein
MAKFRITYNGVEHELYNPVSEFGGE